MTRRPSPANLAAARREGNLQRLMSAERLSRESAELWERAWFAEAGRLGLSEGNWDYFERGLAWIAEQRAAKRT